MTAPIRIFISYRQADHRHFVVRIRDWLIQKYGRDNVFMDFDTLPPFVRFEDFIRDRIAEADAVLPIIGPDWLKLLNEKAQSGDKDYVRIELESALAQKRLIAPICIMGAGMPPPRELPAVLRPLCDTNAARLNDDRTFYDEIARVMDALDNAIANRTGVFREGSPQAIAREKALNFVQQGSKYLEEKNYDAALTAFQNAKAADRTFSESYTYLARVYIVRGQYDAAIRESTAALELNPADHFAYNNRAAAYYHLGKYKEAAQDAGEAIKIKPDFARAHYWSGMAQLQLSKTGTLGAALYRVTALLALTKYLNLGGDKEYGNRAEVDAAMKELSG